uniref:Centromere/kinetochore protein zw10 like n=1 Tax=Talaromyces marneffei PM1 TaxID=1077442 RepID=A0A093V1P7_TALMA
MPSAVNQDDLSKSLLAFVADGKYPDSEDVISANIAPGFLPKGLRDVSMARAQVEDEINSLSRDTVSDVDGWMSQARQLRADIERSRETARNIVAQHERTQPLRARVEDAAAKVKLINTELAFNEGVTHVLEEVQKFSAYISSGRKAVEGERINESITSLEAAQEFLQSSNLSKYSNVASLVQGRSSSLRNDIVNLLLSCWTRQVRVSKNELEIRPNKETVNGSFQQGLLDDIIQPILMLDSPGKSRGVSVEDNGVYVGEPSSSSIPEVIDRLLLVFRYLQEKLPMSMSVSVAEAIIPKTSTMLNEHWLNRSIPLDLEDIQGFESTLIRVTEFTGAIENLGWKGQEELVSWVNQFPRLWLTRRRVDSLDQVRKILVQSKGTTKEVQRVEKEVVTSTDDVLLDTGVADDWDANWGNESEGEAEEAVQTTTTTEVKADDDDEDVDAWGLGEEEEEDNAKANDDEHDEDAWGWGDDVDEVPGTENHEPVVETQPPIKKQHETPPAEKRSATKEITLTEHYTITDIPDSVIALIQQQVTDSASLATPEFSSSRVSASGNGLLALPTLIIAMFKAIASSFYSLKLNAGHIYLYNDSLYLAEQVRNLVEKHELTRLTADVEGLERFGKLSYSKEMQTQRTIVTDLLDGSQGFVQCSEQPFLRECENAIDATVDRIRSVFKEWQPILSHSALLQAMGSLLSSVINKMIIDVEDLSDISEAESQTLVTLCNKLSTLEDIFIPEPDVGATSMAAVYVRNWLKFQYLINILESSLADIKFLWTEGELHLEFSAEEVIELITALFAESDHRRRTISEIRRTHR